MLRRKTVMGKKPKATAVMAAAALLMVASSNCLEAAAASDIPEPTVKAPLMDPEESVSTLIPSESAPGQGLAVNIIFPKKPRYADGAPVAVIAPGGAGADGLGFSMHATQVGIAEVRMAFPGGGRKEFSSGGIYDYRGGASQLAFKDVCLFAAGKTVDTQGRHIQDLVPIKLSQTNVGIVGWSNGGNIALVTMAKCPDDLSCISWIAFYESPVGAMFFPPNLGGARDLLINRHYRQGSSATGNCIVDYRKLRFEPGVRRFPGEARRKGEPELAGVLYFDENGNGRWEESTEFAFSYLTDVGLDKQIYPPDVAGAMQRFGRYSRWVDVAPKKLRELAKPKVDKNDEKAIAAAEEVERKERMAEYKLRQQARKEGKPMPKDNFKLPADVELPKNMIRQGDRVLEQIDSWPPAIAKLDESEAFYQERDGSLYIAEVTAKYPNLLVMVFGSQIDHLQRQPDHPHIALLYNALLSNKVHWLRLNPDPAYISKLVEMNVSNFSNNKPNSPIDASNINSVLEQEGMVPDYAFMDAAIAELADRRRTKNLNGPLTTTLVEYVNEAQAHEAAVRAFGPTPKSQK